MKARYIEINSKRSTLNKRTFFDRTANIIVVAANASKNILLIFAFVKGSDRLKVNVKTKHNMDIKCSFSILPEFNKVLITRG
jgi:hypothetical protein